MLRTRRSLRRHYFNLKEEGWLEGTTVKDFWAEFREEGKSEGAMLLLEALNVDSAAEVDIAWLEENDPYIGAVQVMPEFYFMVDGKEAHIPATLRTVGSRKNIDKAALSFKE